MMNVLFPLWQIDLQEYEAVCAHLGMTPKQHLYDKLSGYLAEAPFRFRCPRGFSLYLAGRRLTRWRIAVMDVVTKLILPGHPIRHVLNGTMALHECDGPAYAEMAQTPVGWAVLPKALFGAFAYAARFTVAMPWLGWQFVAYKVRMIARPSEELASKRILVTGVNRGLGRDLMLHCLERGAEVIGTVRTEQALESVRSWLPRRAPATLLVADLSQPGSLIEAVRTARIPAESLRMAILSAGVKHDGDSVLALASLRDTFQVNYFSAAEFASWFCDPTAGTIGAAISPLAAEYDKTVAMASAGPRTRVENRSLVVVSSMGRWHGMHSSAGYNASKAALSIWAESVDMERRRSGSRSLSVTIVEPGMFESGMTRATSLTQWLFVSRREVASRIVAGALAGRATMRPPLWFAILTWCVCIAGRNLRYRLFARAKTTRDRQ